MSQEDAPKLNTPDSRNKKIKDNMLSISKLYVDDVISDEEYEDFRKVIDLYVQNLRNKYPNCDDYRVLHILTSSTISESHSGIIEDDFPGEDSIEKFVDNISKKYIK